MKQKRKVSRSERLAYGVHAVEEALLAGEAEQVVMLEGATGEAARIEALALQRGVLVTRQPARYLLSLVGKVAHQGVVAYVRPFVYATASELLKLEAPLVVCWGIEDPGNLGAVLRAAAGLGAGGVFVSERGTAQVGAAVRKGAAGCLHKIPLARGDVMQFLCLARESGRRIVAAVASGGEELNRIEPPASPLALLVGSEGKGLPDEALSLADVQATIPLHRDVESLNVAVAVGLLLWWAAGR